MEHFQNGTLTAFDSRLYLTVHWTFLILVRVLEYIIADPPLARDCSHSIIVTKKYHDIQNYKCIRLY